MGCTDRNRRLAEALNAAVSDIDERSQRGKNARQCAIENYSWQAIAQQITDSYQTLLNPVQP